MLRTILVLFTVLQAAAFELPQASSQCVVGIAGDWNSSRVMLSTYEKSDGQWIRIDGPWPGRLGKNGLVWGRGMHPNPTGATLKKEGDGKAPAGVFSIGGAWGYEPTPAKHPRLFYRQVTARDLWVEDPKSTHYNKHLILDHAPTTKWEKQQQMRQGDYPHSLKLFIAHNAPPKVVPNAGSAIFFHIWRGGGSRATAGCTTVEEQNLRRLVAWIDPTKQPLYVLLPESEYAALRDEWRLP